VEVVSKVFAVVAATAQLLGILLLAGQARAAQRELTEMDAANSQGHLGGSYSSQAPAYEALRRLLGEQAHPRWALALLITGTVSGLISALLA
jgi:hypothetical protein